MSNFVVIIGQLVLLISWTSSSVSSQRPPNGQDTVAHCSALNNGFVFNTTLTKPDDITLKQTSYDCYYYARCGSSGALEYIWVNVLKEDIQRGAFGVPANLARYMECIMYASIYCHRGPCSSKPSVAVGADRLPSYEEQVRKCINNKLVKPATNWPCYAGNIVPPQPQPGPRPQPAPVPQPQPPPQPQPGPAPQPAPAPGPRRPGTRLYDDYEYDDKGDCYDDEDVDY